MMLSPTKGTDSMLSIIREKTFLKPAILWTAWLLVTVGIASETVGQSLQVTPLGQWPDYLRMPPGQVVVSGDHAYLGFSPGGVQVINISNPAFPVRVGLLASSNAVSDLAVSRSHIWIAAGAGGLEVVNAAN